jgi:hypothetical protein
VLVDVEVLVPQAEPLTGHTAAQGAAYDRRWGPVSRKTRQLTSP